MVHFLCRARAYQRTSSFTLTARPGNCAGWASHFRRGCTSRTASTLPSRPQLTTPTFSCRGECKATRASLCSLHLLTVASLHSRSNVFIQLRCRRESLQAQRRCSRRAESSSLRQHTNLIEFLFVARRPGSRVLQRRQLFTVFLPASWMALSLRLNVHPWLATVSMRRRSPWSSSCSSSWPLS